METKRLTANERDAMIRMCAAMAILGTEPEKLTQRFKIADLPYINRDIGMLRSVIAKIIEHLTKTIPAEQLQSWKKQVHNTTYNVGVTNFLKLQSNEKDYGIWLSFDTVYKLIAGCHDTCLMCSLDKVQRRSCPLKKALDTIPNDSQDRVDGDCQYYGLI